MTLLNPYMLFITISASEQVKVNESVAKFLAVYIDAVEVNESVLVGLELLVMESVIMLLVTDAANKPPDKFSDVVVILSPTIKSFVITVLTCAEDDPNMFDII